MNRIVLIIHRASHDDNNFLFSELYSDYLDSKKIKESEKMKFLSKVPALTTAKIQYLRTKFYK